MRLAKCKVSWIHTFKWVIAIVMLFVAGVSLAASENNLEYILVTGFEPFGGDKTNGSWEAVRHLQGAQFSNRTVVISQLPVIWGEAAKELRGLIRKYHPVAIIAFGQAGAEPVRLELVARNVRDNEPDNRGILPTSLFVSESAPPSLKTTLNVDAIAKQLYDAGIPVTVSNNAGGYLCNETFFVLMNDPGTKQALNIRRGFVHVPPLNVSVHASDGHDVLFDLKTLERTADIIVETVAKDFSPK